MSDWVIHAAKLGKRYRIGAPTPGYRTLRESIVAAARRPLLWAASTWRRQKRRVRGDDLWALRNISFEIHRAEVVAIIGGNGAGKSTLLKILSRITEPTKGYAEIRGRVGSLLEVGTGFHPELSGRENIYLNGAILGMGRAEIDRKLDEIVAFAEVDKFLDTPVKKYSSGMYLRLAFAVAAHLEPDILLVDEVLAVGDIAFQNKCLGRMENVARQGRTVLFVSHNMAAVRSLCTSGIFLHNGRIKYAGEVSACIREYFSAIGVLRGGEVEQHPDRPGLGHVSLVGISGNTIQQSQSFTVQTVLRLPRAVSAVQFFLVLKDMHGRQICHLRRESSELALGDIPAGEHLIRVQVPALWLNPGIYSLQFKASPSCDSGHTRYVSNCFPLDVHGVSSQAECVLNPAVDWSVGIEEGVCIRQELEEAGRVVVS